MLFCLLFCVIGSMLSLCFTVCLVFGDLLSPWFFGGCGLICGDSCLVVLVTVAWFSGFRGGAACDALGLNLIVVRLG